MLLRKFSLAILTPIQGFHFDSVIRVVVIFSIQHDMVLILWTSLGSGYIHTAINDGPGCLTLRCADPSCGSAIGEDMVLSLVSLDDQKKYMRYLLRSYVEDNRKVLCSYLDHFYQAWSSV